MDINTGLGRCEVEQRIKAGMVNKTTSSHAKTTGQIIRSNTITFFNILNIALAALVIIFGDIRNALFMIIIIINTAVGIIQEIRAKRIIDKLSLISAPKARVIRDGVVRSIAVTDIVLSDYTKLTAGMQICADSVVLEGECEVNESIITGESDPVTKVKGDELLSGSFVVSGAVTAQVIRVGDNNFANKIINNVKYIKHPRSQIKSSMNRLIKGIAFCIIPIGLILIYKSIFILGGGLEDAITGTVAALIGMIPEGLVLLISAVFSISVIRLSRHKALVQELHSVETLARVNVLCLDKTGTITTGKMSVGDIIVLEKETQVATLKKAMANLMAALPDENPTALSLREHFSGTKPDESWQPVQVIPFSSARKWSGVNFGSKGSYIIGAPEFIFRRAIKDSPSPHIIPIEAKKFLNSNMPSPASGFDEDGLSPKIKDLINQAAKKGWRVVMLAGSYLPFEEGGILPKVKKPLALFIISEQIRKEAPETLKYFKEQGVDIKIISGDNPVTVSGIAGRVGLSDYDRYIDMSGVISDGIQEITEKYSVFGRVSPDQKLEIIKSLKSKGHTVGMTGDGVNDVLALKESDCSIAMQSGSDAAKNVSNLILLESNFAVLPKVVAEGRRSINNIERSAVLFLSKTVYAAIIALFFVFVNSPFPFMPIQMTVINACFIGAPSFLLALEPNLMRQKGKFILNVLKRAVPFGLCSLICVLGVTVFGQAMKLSAEQISTVSTYIYGASSFAILCRICLPFNPFRASMTILLGALFTGAVVLLREFIGHVPLTEDMIVLCLAVGVCILPLIIFLPNIAVLVMRLFSKNKSKPE